MFRFLGGAGIEKHCSCAVLYRDLVVLIDSHRCSGRFSRRLTALCGRFLSAGLSVHSARNSECNISSVGGNGSHLSESYACRRTACDIEPAVHVAVVESAVAARCSAVYLGITAGDVQIAVGVNTVALRVYIPFSAAYVQCEAVGGQIAVGCVYAVVIGKDAALAGIQIHSRTFDALVGLQNIDIRTVVAAGSADIHQIIGMYAVASGRKLQQTAGYRYCRILRCAVEVNRVVGSVNFYGTAGNAYETVGYDAFGGAFRGCSHGTAARGDRHFAAVYRNTVVALYSVIAGYYRDLSAVDCHRAF